MFEKVQRIIEDQLGSKVELSLETTFDEIGIDSFGMFELIVAIENEFQIEVTVEEVKNIKNVRQIINFLESKSIAS